MKKYLYSLVIASAAMGMASCSDSNQPQPQVQWYPVVTLEGDAVCYVEINSNWTLPGYSAINTMTGEDATADVEVLIYDVIAGGYVRSIDTSSPGMYQVYYNSYGSIATTNPTVSKIREVYVYDPTIEVDISGSYNINMDESIYLTTEMPFSYYAEGYGYVTSASIQISQLLPGFFEVSDLLGGWYDQIRGYDVLNPGYDFKMSGYIALNSDNTITLLSSYIPAWGDSLDGMWDGEYDEETQTITYETWYADYAVGMYLVMTNANAE